MVIAALNLVHLPMDRVLDSSEADHLKVTTDMDLTRALIMVQEALEVQEVQEVQAVQEE